MRKQICRQKSISQKELSKSTPDERRIKTFIDGRIALKSNKIFNVISVSWLWPVEDYSCRDFHVDTLVFPSAALFKCKRQTTTLIPHKTSSAACIYIYLTANKSKTFQPAFMSSSRQRYANIKFINCWAQKTRKRQWKKVM